MKILVIGSGPVGSSICNNLLKNKKNNIYLSESSDEYIKYHKPFSSLIPLYRIGYGGLGNYWHRVCDLSNTSINGYRNELHNNILCDFGINKKVIAEAKNLNNSEFIPLLPKSIQNFNLKKRNSITHVNAVSEIKHQNSLWNVKFINHKQHSFDKVFLCAGIHGDSDILINSGLARPTNFLSDHIIINVDEKILKSNNFIKTKHFSKGFLRKFEIIDNMKVSYRASYKGNKSSIIYSDNAYNIFKSLVKLNSYNSYLEAFNLRYGTPIHTNYVKRFIQIPVNNIYIIDNNNNISLNSEVHQEIISNTNNYLGHHNFTIESGIHYWGKVNLNEDMKYLEKNGLFICGSAHWNSAPETHFTFQNILKGLHFSNSFI